MEIAVDLGDYCSARSLRWTGYDHDKVDRSSSAGSAGTCHDNPRARRRRNILVDDGIPRLAERTWGPVDSGSYRTSVAQWRTSDGLA